MLFKSLKFLKFKQMSKQVPRILLPKVLNCINCIHYVRNFDKGYCKILDKLIYVHEPLCKGELFKEVKYVRAIE